MFWTVDMAKQILAKLTGSNFSLFTETVVESWFELSSVVYCTHHQPIQHVDRIRDSNCDSKRDRSD